MFYNQITQTLDLGEKKDWSLGCKSAPKIPVTNSPWFGANEEDGVLLAAVEKPEDPSEVFPH